MMGHTACIMKYWLFALTFTNRSQSSSVDAAKGRRGQMPALLTRMSMLPKSATTRSTSPLIASITLTSVPYD